MRVPGEAGQGKAQVTLSFPAWKEGHVSPATFAILVVEPRPEAKKADKK